VRRILLGIDDFSDAAAWGTTRRDGRRVLPDLQRAPRPTGLATLELAFIRQTGTHFRRADPNTPEFSTLCFRAAVLEWVYALIDLREAVISRLTRFGGLN